MSLSAISDIWKIIKPSIEVGDASEAAELLVNYLVDNDFDKQEITKLFKRDSEIQHALSFYLEKPEDAINLVEEYLEDDLDYYDDDYDDDGEYDDY